MIPPEKTKHHGFFFRGALPSGSLFGCYYFTANFARLLVPAFCEEYFAQTGVPIVAVSCSEGGTRIDQWQAGGGRLQDAVSRLNAAKAFLNSASEYQIRHIYMVWCQGESDARNSTAAAQYQALTLQMFQTMKENGVEKCFMIGIGNYNGTEDPSDSFVYIQQAQKELCLAQEDFLLVSVKFAELTHRMKDDFHFYQDAYNLVGKDAGKTTGLYVRFWNSTEQNGADLTEYGSGSRDEVEWGE